MFKVPAQEKKKLLGLLCPMKKIFVKPCSAPEAMRVERVIPIHFDSGEARELVGW